MPVHAPMRAIRRPTPAHRSALGRTGASRFFCLRRGPRRGSVFAHAGAAVTVRFSRKTGGCPAPDCAQRIITGGNCDGSSLFFDTLGAWRLSRGGHVAVGNGGGGGGWCGRHGGAGMTLGDDARSLRECGAEVGGLGVHAKSLLTLNSAVPGRGRLNYVGTLGRTDVLRVAQFLRLVCVVFASPRAFPVQLRPTRPWDNSSSFFSS